MAEEVLHPCMSIKDRQHVWVKLREEYINYQGVLGGSLGKAEKDGMLTGKLGIVVLV